MSRHARPILKTKHCGIHTSQTYACGLACTTEDLILGKEAQSLTNSTTQVPSLKETRERTMEYQKECSVGAHTAQILMRSPATCAQKHDRACKRCWENHLSNEVETMDTRDGVVRCMFCLAGIGRDDLIRLARKGTFERYAKACPGASTWAC